MFLTSSRASIPNEYKKEKKKKKISDKAKKTFQM